MLSTSKGDYYYENFEKAGATALIEKKIGKDIFEDKKETSKSEETGEIVIDLTKNLRKTEPVTKSEQKKEEPKTEENSSKKRTEPEKSVQPIKTEEKKTEVTLKPVEKPEPKPKTEEKRPEPQKTEPKKTEPKQTQTVAKKETPAHS